MMKKVQLILKLLILVALIILALIYFDVIGKVEPTTISQLTTVQELTKQSTEETTEVTTEISTQMETTTEKTTDEAELFSDVPFYQPHRQLAYEEYAVEYPELLPDQVVAYVNVGIHQPHYTGIFEAGKYTTLKVICNKYRKLPDSFEPTKLKDIPKGYYVEDGKPYYQLRQEALMQFISMVDAAKKDGVVLKAISAYRSKEYQTDLYNYYVNTYSKQEADTYSARPRHSEHETGLAVDINDVNAAFDQTEAFAWLSEHAKNYGFILRYGKDQEWITGYMYEPWHYRYLGIDLAQKVVDSGMSYEEYYARNLE